VSDQHRSEMPQVLSLFHVIASGVGIIVGAGIYVLLGPAAQDAGGLVWAAFIVSAGVCALTAMSYAELSSMFSRTGGEYEYASHVFGRTVTFMIGWAMLAGLVVAAATVSLGFGRYAVYFWDIDERVPAIAVLALCTLLASWGAEKWSRVVVVLGAAQVAGLVFIIAIGFTKPPSGALLEGSASGAVGGILSAAALVFFAYIGFDEVATLSEETKDPTRNTPRALLWSLGISAVLYVLVSLAAVNILGPGNLARSSQPLADVAATAVGSRAGSIMAAFAMLTTMNTVLLVLTAASRMGYAMARRGDLPEILSRIDRRGSPMAAVVFSAAVAALFASIGDLGLIASATDFTIYVIFLSVNVMVVVLRLREPDRPRPFRSPFNIGRWPLLPLVGFAVTLWMMGLLSFDGIIVGIGIFAVGGVVAVVRGLMNGSPRV
jgi:APA family basic amino acid/polyamine antiporter